MIYSKCQAQYLASSQRVCTGLGGKGFAGATNESGREAKTKGTRVDKCGEGCAGATHESGREAKTKATRADRRAAEAEV
jgi:hypothetical protein